MNEEIKKLQNRIDELQSELNRLKCSTPKDENDQEELESMHAHECLDLCDLLGKFGADFKEIIDKNSSYQHKHINMSYAVYMGKRYRYLRVDKEYLVITVEIDTEAKLIAKGKVQISQ